MTVVAPDGTAWRVSLRWLPRPPRWLGFGSARRRRSGEGRGWAWAEGSFDLAPDLELAALVVAVVVAVLLAGLFVFPALVFVLDVLLVVLLAGVAVAGRVLLRRPWVVEARSGTRSQEWRVVGWRASRRAIRSVADDLRRGVAVDAISDPAAGW